MTMLRRDFLELMAAPVSLAVAGHFRAQQAADFTLRISPLSVEIAPGRVIKTIGYNGTIPGPLLRFREGQSVTVDVDNETDNPELVHWHGLFASSDVDGAMEEGTPMVPSRASRRYTFAARPAGTRWYHTHGAAGRDLKRSTYTGQFGFLYIEPSSEPGRYDAEVFLALHGWDPRLTTEGDPDGALEVVYRSFSVNDRALGHGEPVRVANGQRVMFRVLNASATMTHRLALAGHTFRVVALDGNLVPAPREVGVLELGPAERVDAVVIMNQPGVWILGETDDQVRNAGLGIVVEYANSAGPPRWPAPASTPWAYTLFGRGGEASGVGRETIPLVFRKKFAGHRWVDNWTINGKSYPKTDPILVRQGRRYRLLLDNQSDEAHPVHLHRHSFELTKFAGTPTGGITKDVIVLPPSSQVEVDFLADNPGPTLFHCHQQLHMDFGFMTLLRYSADR
jgi:FtsP/CotA-like multicopper oxidase with cupredoxin domain